MRSERGMLREAYFSPPMDAHEGVPAARYEAPIGWVLAFHAGVLVWAVSCGIVLGIRLGSSWNPGVLQIAMVAFVLGYTPYFSAGVAYRAEVLPGGALRLVSLRRTLTVSPREIAAVEGPAFGAGFVRFRLTREKAYLLGSKAHPGIQEVISALVAENPDLKRKGV